MKSALPKACLSFGLLVCPAFILCTAQAGDPADKPRVFITDSQSWETGSYSGGGPGGGGSVSKGGARPQTAEIIKTFGERCPQVVTNNIQQRADYVVLLDHEGGKSFVRHKNKVAVFARVSGDSIVSKSTLSLGGSVQEACDAIKKDWEAHGGSMRAAAVPPAAPKLASAPVADPPLAAAPASSAVATPAAAPPAAAPVIFGKLSITSAPDGAEIEIDGNFVGNAPSEVQLSDGDYFVVVKKPGFKDWQKKLKVTAGSNVRVNAELEKAATQ
jgi:hypothetical protein